MMDTVSKFDEKQFNDCLQEYYTVKKNKPVYVRSEWLVNEANATELKGILDRMAVLLCALINENALLQKNFEVKAARGVTYYPRVPWIGVFAEKETARNGIYPVVVFPSKGDGFYIGCADSIANPQPGFIAECYTREELKRNESLLNGKIPYDEHLAKGAVWFPHEELVGKEKLISALRAAIAVWERCRRHEGHTKSTEAMDWCKVVHVKDFYDWLSLIRKMTAQGADGNARHWAFRGQSDSEWDLTSSLERYIKYNNDRIEEEDEVEILRKEREGIENFRRELSKEFGYRTHKNVDLLALMQHYGSKTRLIDFSLSPLIAAFMASDDFQPKYWKFEEDENRHEQSGIAIWAIDLDVFRPADCKGEWFSFVNESSSIANKILSGKREEVVKHLNGKSVLPVFPKIGNARLSAQEGLFLMPISLTTPLRDNIRNVIINTKEYKPDAYLSCELKTDIAVRTDCMAYKFIFNFDASVGIANALRDLCISAKIAYPDLTGLAKSATPRLY